MLMQCVHVYVQTVYHMVLYQVYSSCTAVQQQYVKYGRGCDEVGKTVRRSDIFL